MKVKLIKADNEFHARLIKGLLEEKGISCHIVSSNQNYEPGILGINNGIVPYDVFISDKDLEQAKNILQNGF